MNDQMIKQEILTNSQDKDIVLSVKGVSKKFCRSLKRSLFYGVQDIGSELMGIRGELNELRPQEFWALNDVSFALRRGEALGLVGPNGSGKTTMMRIIAGLIKPDTGYVEVQGTIAPLIALGAGFNPILTGRENIYANMSILGLSKKEIQERYDEVVDFAEIEDAIDAPVQSYSSGMAARLGFACAIHTSPDILLIDEVLAVGDAKFRAKCQRKLHELRQKSTSFIMVSHSSHSISTVCQSAIYLKLGKVISYGQTVDVLNQYEEDLFLGDNLDFRSNNQMSFWTKQEPLEALNQELNITSIFFRDNQKQITYLPVSGESVSLVVTCNVYKDIKKISLNLEIIALEDSERLIVMSSWDDDVYFNLSPGTHEIQVTMPCLSLGTGLYLMKLAIRHDKLALLDRVDSFYFTVKKSICQSGNSRVYQCHSWESNLIANP